MKTGLLLSNIDREDYWVSGVVFPVNGVADSYENGFIEIRERLFEPEIVAKLVEELSLREKLALVGEVALVDAKWNGYSIRLTFSDEVDERIDFQVNVDYIAIA